MRLFLPHLLLSTVLAATLTGASALPGTPTTHLPPMLPNPLLTPSSLPLQMPAFDQIADDHWGPAFAMAMQEGKREVEAIAAQSAPPTFANTIVALERAGRLLARIRPIFSNLVGTDTNPTLQKLEKELSPVFAAYRDSIMLNPALFARVDAVYQVRDQLDLDAESRRLVEKTHNDFVRAGARLAPDQQAKLKTLNARLATLQTAFSQNVLQEVNASAVLVAHREELDGLSEPAIQAAAKAAQAAGHEGAYLLRLQNTTGQPLLAQLHHRPLRERIYQASLIRGSRGGDYDNRAIVAELARLRAERAQLLGYPNHAAFVLEDQTAGSIGAVENLLAQLTPPAVANARQEAADLQAMIDREGGGFQLEPWDWDYYAEKVRRERFAYDESELRPYFELNRVLEDGVFYTAQQLFGLTFHERHDLPVYHPDVRVWEVRDEGGSLLAIFLGDFYARPSKRGGAWMNSYVSQSTLLGTQPVVGNHLNVVKPPEGEPTLLTFDEATTLFHEFGHGLHGMLSDVNYPRFSGTAVPRDFVEFPSKAYEMWVSWTPVLQNFGRHYRTGEPMPAELLEKVLAAQKYNQGFATTEYLAAALLDQAWHQLTPEQVPAPEDVVAFEAQALQQAGVALAAVPPRYRSTYFSHVFSGGYSSGYYAYIWAEVLDADAVGWFKERGGLDRTAGEHYRRQILSRGGTAQAMELYRAFRGGDPAIEPLLERRGLLPTTSDTGS
jgi:peptidyl-dipeptidase Dcp